MNGEFLKYRRPCKHHNVNPSNHRGLKEEENRDTMQEILIVTKNL